MLSPRLVAHLLVALVALAAGCLSVHAQTRVDTIKPNPDAARLRPIWARQGANREGFGTSVASLWDIDGDGRREFAVGGLGSREWNIYGLDSLGEASVRWSFPLSDDHPLLWGRFLDLTEPQLLVPTARGTDRIGVLTFLTLYTTSRGRIADTPTMMWRSSECDRAGQPGQRWRLHSPRLSDRQRRVFRPLYHQ